MTKDRQDQSITAAEGRETAAREEDGLAYWEDRWERLRRESLLKASQVAHPDRWREFYDQVAPVWERMSGGRNANQGRLADFILENGLAAPGQAVLEVGCGTGTLAMCLVRRGVRVTALDSSQVMIRRLKDQAGPEGAGRLEALCLDWEEYRSPQPFDLVVAGFFPQALSPRGLTRLESFSRGRCLLFIGDGRETFPLRRRIWRLVMGEAPPPQGFHLECTHRYLQAAGRRPGLHRLAWPVEMDLTPAEVELFYRRYFALFDQQGPQVDGAVAQVLEPHVQDGRVRLDGTFSLAAVEWASPAAASARGGGGCR